jgi:hypothetical protein
MRLSPAWLTRILSGCSPPEDKTPGSLIYAWGIEMLRLGFELGVELLSDTQEKTDKEDIKK